MRIRLQDSFIHKLNRQVAYIAWDKPGAARNFKNELLQRIKRIAEQPLKHRKSIYFENENIRDLIFKGYTIVYYIKPEEKEIVVFGLIKNQIEPGNS